MSIVNQFNESGYLLLVEDEPLVQANNKMILGRRGYSLRQAYSLAEARSIIAQEPPRAIILDIQLPDGSGLDLLQELRGGKVGRKNTRDGSNSQYIILNTQSSNVPVLMLTALGTPEDVIQGLMAGGDDYLPKPYDLSVFLMRVEALLRRASIIPDTLGIGPIKLEPAAGHALLNGEDMRLPQKEYSLLQEFTQHPGKILSAEYLYVKVWGQEFFDEDTALKVAISKLRAKLAGSGYTITASRGEGYYIEKE